MRIGFIGLGKMGHAIAANLAAAGHELTVFNRTASKAEEFANQRGARRAASPAEAARAAEAVFTMLADDPAVEEVVWKSGGILEALSKGAVHVSQSTISTQLAQRLEQAHAEKGQHFVSAPVFGRPDAAENRKLLVAAAGQAAQLQKLKPLFEAIGRQIFMVGQQPWQANAVKLSGNFMIASVMEAFGETFAVMQKAGLDPHTFLEIMSELFGSPVYKNYGGAIANGKFEPAGFALKLGFKDVRLALEAARDLAVPMPFASVLRDQFLSAIAAGQQDLDWSSVALVAARNAGLR